MQKQGETTPSNCRLKTCAHNQINPPENSQECVACEGLRSGLVYREWKWVPKLTGKKGLEEAARLFHKHLENCAQCRDHPFALCIHGQALLEGIGKVEK